ncbi:MAG: hypothetical protein HRT58_12360 [Crocinitomicaceae bacterium]|nr:hypothetical protein [Flavobacteriales bacterium]NQZ36455.1 hypothetical protein [Crocinitomicaceae bacterium]
MKNYILCIFCLLANVSLSQKFWNANENEEFQKFDSDLNTFSEIHPGETCNILSDFSLSVKCDLHDAHLLIKKHGYRLIWQHDSYGGVETCRYYEINAPSPYPICDTPTINSTTVDSTISEYAIYFEQLEESYSLSCYSFGDKYICLDYSLHTGSINGTYYYYIKNE